MLKVGLTGGIGCGKSTVADIFRQWQIPIIDADIIAHELVAIGQPALLKLTELFGASILQVDGSLNRSILREIILNDPQQKATLENLLHPLIYEKITTEINLLNQAYCIISIPLLFETKMTDLVDRVLVIDCTEEEQINRLLKRDGMTIKIIKSFINSQVSRDYRISHADDLINNTETHDKLAEDVKKLHNLYLSISSH